MPLIYMNSAGHGSPSERTLRRVAAHVSLELSAGPAQAAIEARAEVARVKANAATLIGAEAADVGLTSTTSSAWLEIVARLKIRGRRLLAAPHEWGDNLNHLRRMAENAGAVLEILPPLDLAAPDLSEWAARIDEDVAAIFCPMVTSVRGLRYPVEAIGGLPRPETCFYVIDAAQALGQTEVNIGEIQCDALVSTCRKWLRGPRETALFWTHSRVPAEMRAAALQPNDVNIALVLGMGAAIEQALEIGVPDLERRVRALSGAVYQAGRNIGLDTPDRRPPMSGAVTFQLPEESAPMVEAALSERRMIAKFPKPASDEPMSKEASEGGALMRISPNLYNTEDEVAEVIACVSKALHRT